MPQSEMLLGRRLRGMGGGVIEWINWRGHEFRQIEEDLNEEVH